MFKVIGISTSEGEYKGFAYNNTILHCTYENKGVNGLAVKPIKVKSSIFAVCPCDVGDVVDFYYDRFGNVTQVYKVK